MHAFPSMSCREEFADLINKSPTGTRLLENSRIGKKTILVNNIIPERTQICFWVRLRRGSYGLHTHSHMKRGFINPSPSQRPGCSRLICLRERGTEASITTVTTQRWIHLRRTQHEYRGSFSPVISRSYFSQLFIAHP